MKIIGVIPARYESSRLPGKPLADICGKPMIWWVYQNAVKITRLDQVYVATDDERIMNKCREMNIACLLTSKSHPTGSDRVSEVANRLDGDIYVTIQGDEPLLEEDTINKVIDILVDNPNTACATLKTAFRNSVDVVNRTTPKVVCDVNDNMMLISRAEIPYPHKSLNYVFYKPIGTYAFTADAIKLYGKLERGPIELAEDSELIRFIEHGIAVKVGTVDSETIAVDTEKDLERVRKIIMMRCGQA